MLSHLPLFGLPCRLRHCSACQSHTAMSYRIALMEWKIRERIKAEKPTPKNTHPNKKSLRKQFSGLFVQTVLPLSFKLSKRHAERVWANCLHKLFSIECIGVGVFFCGGFLSLERMQNNLRVRVILVHPMVDNGRESPLLRSRRSTVEKRTGPKWSKMVKTTILAKMALF